ncbi:MAG: AI-2E family transporter [Deltaproteobacteria bacterium]|nr:AI-2E family transporter [Deltaproteobacteria bacterium]MBI3296361.1 AI-2E family transporter [Deltaproteobacteria bacterium]
MPPINWRGILQLVLGLTLSFLFFYMMSPFLIALFLGGVIAMVSFPLHLRLRNHIPGALSAFVVTIVIALGLFLPICAILYSVSFKTMDFVSHFQFSQITTSFSSLVRNIHLDRFFSFISGVFPVDEGWLADQSGLIAQRVVERLSRFVANTAAGAPTLLLGITVTIVTIYFFLLDGGRFIQFLSTLSPLKRDRAQTLYQTFETSCRGVVLGIFLSGVVQGVLVFILFLICRLPNAVLMGSLTVILGMVPLIGSSPIWIGAAIYLFANSHPIYGVIMTVGGIGVSTMDNIVRSTVMSEQSELHPLLALVSVFGAVNLFGASGILLGPIIAAVFVAFLKIVSMELRWETIEATKDLIS